MYAADGAVVRGAGVDETSEDSLIRIVGHLCPKISDGALHFAPVSGTLIRRWTTLSPVTG